MVKVRAILWAIFFYTFGVITTIFGVALQGSGGTDSCLSDVSVLLSTIRQIQAIGESGNFSSTVMESDVAPPAKNQTTATGSSILNDKEGKLAENLFISQGMIQLKYKSSKASANMDDSSEVLTNDDGLKVLAISIFGTDDRYLKPLLHNAEVAPTIYPGWQMRIYHPPDFDEEFKNKLKATGDHIKLVDVSKDLPHWVYGDRGWGGGGKLKGKKDGDGVDPTLWRFFVASDPKVAAYAIRDADSTISIREKAAVDEWLASGQSFHIMHDHPLHHPTVMRGAILAGMWGARRGAVPNMDDLLKKYHEAKQSAGKSNRFGDDQSFLWKNILPLAKDDCVHHDSYYCDESGGIAFPMTREESGAPLDYVGNIDALEGDEDVKDLNKLPALLKCLAVDKNMARYQRCLARRKAITAAVLQSLNEKKGQQQQNAVMISSSYKPFGTNKLSDIEMAQLCFGRSDGRSIKGSIKNK